MPFATQIRPNVLIGPLASLPSAAGIPNGFIYHASDNPAKSFILVIDPVTGIHRWDLIGPTVVGPFLKFSATVNASDIASIVAVLTAYIADDPDHAVSASPLAYPIPVSLTFTQVVANVTQNTLNIPSQIVVYRNGSPLFTSSTIAPAQTGIIQATVTLGYSALQTLDVAVQGTGAGSGTGSMSLSLIMSP
jgi:hypothetical protein